MSMSATISAVYPELTPTRAELERRLRTAYNYDRDAPYHDPTDLGEYRVRLGGGWWFFLNVFTEGDFRERINRYASYDSPLVWAIRGRHPVVQDEDSVYYNAPEDVAAIHQRIETTSKEEFDAAFLREQRAAYDSLIAEGIEPDRVRGLVGERDERPSTELWEEISLFYQRAAAERRYSVCWIG